jgi:hypothetical protein
MVWYLAKTYDQSCQGSSLTHPCTYSQMNIYLEYYQSLLYDTSLYMQSCRVEFEISPVAHLFSIDRNSRFLLVMVWVGILNNRAFKTTALPNLWTWALGKDSLVQGSCVCLKFSIILTYCLFLLPLRADKTTAIY